METPTYKPFLDVLLEAAGNPTRPDGYDTWGWKIVRPDLRSYKDYRWPFPGNTVNDPDAVADGQACPTYETGGFCVALDWTGARDGGHGGTTALLLAYNAGNILGGNEHKLRVRQAYVADLIDVHRAVREHGNGADLTGADLTGADLRVADLNGANLTRANLTGADLRVADLTRANLNGANLTRADLNGADLNGANLTGADLTRADLRVADLTRADLTGADLNGANLTRADLNGADLTGADLRVADLNGANLNGANLTGANLNGANLTRADLTGALSSVS